MAVLAMEIQVEGRLSRLESDVPQMKSDIADMKVDVREIRGDIHRLDVRLTSLDHKIDRKSLLDRLWMTALVVSSMGTMLAVMAHGFKWI